MSQQEAKSLKGDFRLDFRDGLLKGGHSEKPAIIPGRPEASPLIEAIKRTNDDTAMPPKADKKFTAEQVAAFEAWVRMGAPIPHGRPVAAQRPERRREEPLGFKKPQEPVVPTPKNAAWMKNDVDRFVLAKLEAKGMIPAPAADKTALVRRATFDLHGLPPTPDEVAAFVDDKSADAFATVVDRLLSSPRYGERWGRYWLDVARYADTKGYVFGGDAASRSPTRIATGSSRAFNEDLPYDQFLLQQIAADRLPLGDDKLPARGPRFPHGRPAVPEQSERHHRRPDRRRDPRHDGAHRELRAATITSTTRSPPPTTTASTASSRARPRRRSRRR